MRHPKSISLRFSFYDQFEKAERRPAGFDYMRLGLAVAIVAFHAVLICGGQPAWDWLLGGPLRPLVLFLVPSFFALSGFLVAGSLERNSLSSFFTLRALRILPALAVEVTLSAFVIGTIFTTWPLSDYFTSGKFWLYLCNMVGWVHYRLPGVFLYVPFGNNVNGQLWTVPIELECYIGLGVLTALGVALNARKLIAVSCLLALALTAYQFLSPAGQARLVLPTGRMLMATTLFGVWMYVGRRHVPFNWPLFGGAILLCWALLTTTQLTYLASLPIAYITVFVGLLTPARTFLVTTGDYSYGIYLYSFPLQQSLAELFPNHRYWELNFVAGLALSAICAIFSWHLIESKVLGTRKLAVKYVDAVFARLGMRSTAKAAGAGRRDVVFARSFFSPWWRAWISRGPH